MRSWRKRPTTPSACRPQPATAGEARPGAARPRRLPRDRVDLSVVVVFYNMRREAQRTLHSLSRAYQEDIDDLDYEVIVVENGSADDQRLGEEFVRGFGPEFRYLDLGADATPSPAPALNRGIADLARRVARADDRRRPRAHAGRPALRSCGPARPTRRRSWPPSSGTSARASRATRSTPATTRRTRTGCSSEIDWPDDGYRLFEIGHFIGDRDWFDGLWESNCLFVPRALLEQVGGFDETFSMPGGGYANLDLFERLGATPGRHRGRDPRRGLVPPAARRHDHQPARYRRAPRRLMRYREHYERLRERPFRGPGKPRHFVGTARRLGAAHAAALGDGRKAFRDAQDVDADGLPKQPMPVPEQLQGEFTEAFWRSLAWQRLTWLGERVERAPTDLVAYQELLAEVRPDWIVAVGAGDGGAPGSSPRSATCSTTAG